MAPPVLRRAFYLLPLLVACGPTPAPPLAPVATAAPSAPPPPSPARGAPADGQRCADLATLAPVPAEPDAPPFIDPEISITQTPKPAPPQQFLRVLDKSNGWSPQVLAEAFSPCRKLVRRADVGERTLQTRLDEGGRTEGVTGVDEAAMRTTRLGRCLVERACALPPRGASAGASAAPAPAPALEVVTMTQPASFHGHVELRQASWTPAKPPPKDEAARLENLRLAYTVAARRCVEEHPSDYPYVFELALELRARAETSPSASRGLGALGEAVIGCIANATRGLGGKTGLLGSLQYDVSVETEPR